MQLFRIELLIEAAWLALAFLARRPLRWGRLGRAFDWIAQRRRLAVVLVGLVAVGSSAFVSLGVAWPEPRVHDEFSYLLAADTFAHGRVAFPPHPFWQHFETFHVNQQPTYASMYPPAQGLCLALGQVIGGHPLVGVWLGFGLACAAVCWMLQAWLPPRWALTGGLLAVGRVGFLGCWGDMPAYWCQSYWGGSIAMLGGALVFGAFRRLLHGPRARDAVILAVGLALLANCRPFEGLVVSLPVGAALLGWMVGRSGPPVGIALRRIVLPVGLVLGATGLAMAGYNARLTGNPLVLPYQQNGAAYAMTPLFLWQPLQSAPEYRHAVIRAYHLDWAVPAYERQRSVTGYLGEVAARLWTLFRFYLGPVLFVPCLALPWVIRKRWLRFAFLVGVVLTAALLVTTWLQPHYAAPATGLVILLVVQGIRHLGLWRWRGRPVGRTLVRSLPVVYLLLVALAIIVVASGVDPASWYQQRALLLDQLRHTSGRHLVVVHYAQDHSPHAEWVFNDADLDAAKVVWARALDPDADRQLLDYYRERHAWLLDADCQPARLMPYPSAGSRE